MRIKAPVSFFLMVVIMIAMAALSVVWSLAHLVAVAVVLGLVPVLRCVAHREGRKTS